MRLKAIYPDGSWIIGKPYTPWWYGVTPGTRHLKVSASSIPGLEGRKVAVVISQVKYFVFGYKDEV